MAIDYGEKRVGLALSDPTLTIAQSLDTVVYQSRKKLITILKEIIIQYNIKKIILGLPLTMKGSDSLKTVEVREFGAELENQIDIPLVFFDERLTSIQAQQIIRQFGKKPSKHRAKIDQIAARTLLQTYLDREKHTGR
ncbi:MAG: Holliday junction resolvase RuvX [Calditrichota bacterium]